MRGWLLDTNVLSELRRPRPHPDVVRFVAAQPARTLFVSTVTLAELRFGASRLADADRRAAIERWLDLVVRPLVTGRVLEIDEDVVLTWRILLEEGRIAGSSFGALDLFIAAAARRHDCVVVSRDVRPFADARVPVLDPWNARFYPSGGSERSVPDLSAPELLGALAPATTT